MTRRTKRAIIWSVVGVFIVIAALVAYYFIAIYNQVDNFQKSGEESPFYNVQTTETKVEEPPKWEGTERVNILLMGVDARGLKKGEIPRSDTMLVASIDPVSKKGYLFSIMRDTYTKIPDHGSDRINTAITHGPNTAMKAVSDLLGIPIQYYVYTDFQGFIELVDAVDGVDFYVEKDMKYTSKADNHEYDIDLKKGFQHLDGTTALQYVRFRHDAMSDYSRTERQRNFLTAVAEKMKSTTSIMKLPSILEKMNPYIDTNLSVEDMWKLATIGYSSQMSSSEQIPPMELLVEKNIGGSEVLGVRDEDDLKTYVQEVFNKKEEAANETDSGTSTSSSNGSNNSATDNSPNGATSSEP
ncbi:cell envelope-related function transcriptional attenuator common domain-containing protein [Fontibacillus panacisegetis]|uniref:Cell envelope-related function transcriptional attenuator common domain-containing protein n=1 Tax=Fontibacillus panacisegetis TaxID=670482 RepID=A0A1G7QGL0_9BACL|nr:LCP family protein [Fontibacillus panacisegetis]SDF97651.1 cell envelope-related function transcriptional attenuator common domain-containing protein [Fontibacillus panacisegetis]